MKSNIILKLLEMLTESSVDAVDLFVAIATSGYGAPMGRIERNYFKRGENRRSADLDRIRSKISKDEWNKINRKFGAILSKLQKDGLIERSDRGKKGFVKITKKGITKISKVKNRELPHGKYKYKATSNPTLFMFDIPEKERNKRAWLRSVLLRMEFKMIQKSVWLGKIKIPEEFLEDLRKLKIIQYVEVLEITKTGTLKQVS